MMRLILLRAGALALALLSTCAPALAQTPGTVTVTGNNGRTVPLQAVAFGPQDGPATPVDIAHPFPVTCASCVGGGGTSGGTATAAPPTYVEAATAQPFSFDLSGYLRTRSKQDGAWNVGITGTLPGFTITPTVNIGTAPTLTVTGALTDTQLRASAPAVKIDQTAPGTTDSVSLKASELHVGQVGGSTIIAAANFTTPSGTTAYASGQLVANSATAGSVAPMSFNVCRVAAGSGMLRRLRLKTPDTGFAGQTVTLKFYRDSPTASNGDHATWLTTESNYIGAVAVTFDQHFSDAEKGIGVPAVGSEINFDCASGSTVIYGLLVAGGAITPQGAKVFTGVVETIAN